MPQYNPTTVVVAGGPAWGYYPTPYPVYYYPYPPGAAFATGLIWGAAIGAAWNGGHWNTNWGGGDININRNTNINTGNINRGNVNSGNVNRPGGGNAANRPGAGGGGTAWKPDKKPGQVSGATGRTNTSARVGDARAGGGGGFSGARWRGCRATLDRTDRRVWRGLRRQSSVDAAFRRHGRRQRRRESRGLRQRVAARQLRRVGAAERIGRLRIRSPDEHGQFARRSEPQFDVRRVAAIRRCLATVRRWWARRWWWRAWRRRTPLACGATLRPMAINRTRTR